jgi:TrmH family RNA methyltransferase
MAHGLITSTHNSKVQEARRLKLAKHRTEARQVLVEGTKHISDAIDGGGRLLRLFVSADAAGVRSISDLVETATARRAEVLLCSDRVVASLSSVETCQGVVALFAAPYTDVAEVVEHMAQGSVGFLLDRLQDPGNLGAIVRTASACGACGVVVSPGTVDPLNDKVVRSSASALFSVGVARVASLAELVLDLKSAGVRVVALDSRCDRSHFDECLTGPLGLLVGNEGDGVSDELLHLSDAIVSIPMPGRAESLNAAVAVSIVAYEAVRQRMRL